MKITPKALVWLGLIGTLLVFSLIGFLFYRSTFAVIKEAEARKQSHNAIISLESLFSYLKDAETGQRGYLLTGKDIYLEPYKEAINKVEPMFMQLQQAVGYNTSQKNYLDRLHILIVAKLDEMQKTLEIQKSQGFSAAVQSVQSNRGKILMDEIRQLIHTLEREELNIYDARDLAVAQSLKNTILFSMVAASFSLCLLAFTGYFLLKEIEGRQRFNLQLQNEIAERKRFETQIHELNRALEKQIVNLEATNRELEAFAYSVSHDLRAPLRSIDGFSKILLTKAQEKLNQEEQRYLANICENSQRMGELIDDLLKLSRLTRTEMTQEIVDLGGMAAKILGDYQKKEPERKTHLKIEENIQVQGDPNLLRVLMDNLLSNAWKFTAYKDVTEIEVGTKNENNKVIYYVQDNGAGFNMKYADKLFGVFQRLHRMDEFPGTGIGLATAQRVIHRHGGKIWAESAVNQGTTFYFTVE